MKSTTASARPLPTRKARALAAASRGSPAPPPPAAAESRQESSAGPPTPGAAADEEGRVPSPSKGPAAARSGDMKPAFVLGRGVPTLPGGGRRSPSPPTSAVSRRGRSRSPVGMTRATSGGGRSRSGSARSGLRTPTASNARGTAGELSSAALAAGEAAANASMSPVRRRGRAAGAASNDDGSAMRSPSPPLARFPSLAHGSFEVTPTLSMSFGGGGSFEWAGNGAAGLPPVPGAGGARGHDGGGHPPPTGHYPPHGGGYGPPPPGGYDGYHGHGRRSPSPAERYRGGYHHEGRDGRGERYYPHHPPAHGYYGGRDGYGGGGYGAYHHGGQHGGRHYARGRSPSPTGRGYYPPHPEYGHPRHPPSTRRSSRSPSPRSGGRGGGRASPPPQALFPEHQLLSSHSREHGHGHGHGTGMPSLSAPERRSSSRGSNRAPSRSSVFRGSPAPRSKDNLPQELLLALEDEESPPPSPSLARPTARRAASSDVPGLSSAPSLLGAVLRDDVNVDDFALDADMSFRRSYDLEQVFSFIGPGAQSDARLSSMSFNLGFTESKEEGVVPVKAAGSEESDGERKLIDHGTGRRKKPPAKRKKSPAKRSRSPAGRPSPPRRGRSGASAADRHLAYQIPTLGTATSGLGLTPINSFAADGEGGPLVPLSSQDGMALRVFFGSDGIEGRAGGEAHAPMVHHTTPPSYSSRGPPGPYRAPSYHDRTPPHAPSSGRGPPARTPRGGKAPRRAPSGVPSGVTSGAPHPAPSAAVPIPGRHAPVPVRPMSYPNKRARLSSSASRPGGPPPAAGRPGRRAGPASGDPYALLRRIAPCLDGFRFRLPGADAGPGGEGATATPAQLAAARRRIDSSVCLFGGSLPPRTVSFDGGDGAKASGEKKATGQSAAAAGKRDGAGDREEKERRAYEEGLPGRYLMKDGCISWEVEVHEVIPSRPGIKKEASASKRASGGAGAAGQQAGAAAPPPPSAAAKSLATPRAGKAKRPSPIDTTSREAMASGQICHPVTPHTPGSLFSGGGGGGGGGGAGGAPASPPGISASSTGGTASTTSRTPVRGKGVKSKYRCKLCGLPKQNHVCPYKNSLERSIGAQAYPAVNAFVSHEPGRLAPALSAMNNFTDLLPGGQQGGIGPSASGTGQPPSRGPPRGYGIRAPVTPHWHPNTPGGLSTMSSSDHGSHHGSPPGNGSSSSSSSAPGTPPSYHGGAGGGPGGGSPGGGGRVGPPAPSSDPNPAGGDDRHHHPDALFRDMTHLRAEQYRAVGGPATAAGREQQNLRRAGRAAGKDAAPAAPSGAKGPAGPPPPGRDDYRYPPVPVPYALRKGMGDALFALSREVPGLADGCASVLRGARAGDSWDQAVAELTTQVLVVLGCDDDDVTLEGLRGQLVQLGIAC